MATRCGLSVDRDNLVEALQAYNEVEGRDFQLLLWRAELLWGEQPGPARRAALRFTSP